jgi:glycosyltransferase involved in cell wall biosynthesis
MNSSPRRFLFVSSCPDAWGGSEELWSGAALQLLLRKNEVIIGRSTPMPSGCNPLRWDALRQAGLMVDHFGSSWLLRTVPEVVLQLFPSLLRSVWWARNFLLSLKLHRIRPHLVVICQGQAYDACYPFSIPEACRFANVPYVIICQKASELEWPSDGLRELIRRCYKNAICSYFVSRHNLRTVEQQLALRLPSAKVVQNPFMVRASKPLPWPESSDGLYRLACVARLWPLEKAQDVLLEVLNHQRWRGRPIMVSFFGDGPMAIGLRQMAEMLNLRNVQFLGFVNATEIWRTHHALVLPSRSEGLPLVQVEAMMCGRPVIVSNAGGSSEIMQHGVHGFLVDGANPSSLNHALEQAWACREEWERIGLTAAQHVKTIYADDPCVDFADELEGLCHSIADTRTNKLAHKSVVPKLPIS